MVPLLTDGGELDWHAALVRIVAGDCRIEPNLVIPAGDYYRAERGSLHAPTFREGGGIFLSVARNLYLPEA